MRKATELEKIINELNDIVGRLFKEIEDPFEEDNFAINQSLSHAQDRAMEARMWVEQAEIARDE